MLELYQINDYKTKLAFCQNYSPAYSTTGSLTSGTTALRNIHCLSIRTLMSFNVFLLLFGFGFCLVPSPQCFNV